MMICRYFVAAAMLASLFVAGAQAQDFPTGPVTFVVPFPPGGSIDVVLRAMAPKLQERMGKPVLIENRAGGGGVIGTAYVAKSPPDGHTLFAAASLLAANPKLYKTLPFDTLKDLQMVSLLFHTPLALVVNPGVPAKSVGELVALLKAKAGELSFAHSGPGSSLHLAAELFQAMTGTRMNGVAYRGAPQGLNDVSRPRHSDHRGSRRPRLRCRRLDHLVRAVGHAEASRRPAACRVEGGRCRAGHSCDVGPAWHHSGRKSVAGRIADVPGDGNRSLGRHHRTRRRGEVAVASTLPRTHAEVAPS